MKKFYLAAQLADHHEASELIKLVMSFGFECTCDWTIHHGSVFGQGLSRYQEVAMAEVKAVKEADFFILLAPGGRDAHVALGVAISRDIPITLLFRDYNDLDKPYPSTFHYLPQVTRLEYSEAGDDLALERWLKHGELP